MSELEPQETPIVETPVAETPAPPPEVAVVASVPEAAPEVVPDVVSAEAPPPAADAKPAAKPQEQRAAKPNERGPQPDRRERQGAPAGAAAGAKPERGPERGRGPDRGPDRGAGGGPDRGPDRGGDRRGPRGPERGGGDRFRGPEPPTEIDLEKLVSDSLYLDNQAHAVVARLRDMDSGTRSQLRRFFSAVRRAYRTAEGERQHEFVMLRARLAYTIARHQLRSLDPLERLLLQVTRKNDAKGYERFRDLFEAIVAYNE